MNKILYAFTGIYMCVVFSAQAVTITYGADEVIDGEIFLSTGTVKNYGILNGPISITDNATVYFENYGQINSIFNYGDDIIIVQEITGIENLHKIYNLSGHTVYVQNASNINMSDLAYTAENAVQIELENSGIILDSNLSGLSVPINIIGNSVVIYIDGASEAWSGTNTPILSNIIGQNPIIQIINNNPMYSVQSNLVSGTLYVTSVRQTTNYASIIPNTALGEYLDRLQTNNPNDPLIQKLNNATNMHQINHILAHSPRTNPVKLMDAVQTIDSFKITNSFYTPDSGVHAKAGYTISDDFSFYNLHLNLTDNSLNDLILVAGLDVGRMHYSDTYDNASGMLYGGILGLHYTMSDYFVNLFGTFSYAQFYDIAVFDGKHTVKNPHGTSETVVLDSGFKLRAFDILDVSPFVGVHFYNANLLGNTSSDISGRAGFNLRHDSKFDENLYSIGVNAYAETNNNFYIGVNTDVLSSADGLSAGAGIGVIYDDMGWTYRLSANAKFLF